MLLFCYAMEEISMEVSSEERDSSATAASFKRGDDVLKQGEKN